MKKKLEIVVDYCESDIGKMLDQIIKSPHKTELLKLLTPLVCHSPEAVKNFIKISTGIILYDPIPPNTCAYIDVDDLGWGVDKDVMRVENLIKDDNTILVSIIKHNGYHTIFDYDVSYVSTYKIDASTGQKVPVNKTASVKKDDLIIFKEF